MYKIMTKLHTTRENVFAFHMVSNDINEKVEYSVKTKNEAAEMALELLGKVGYEDLRIVDDQSYYLDLIYGRKPVPVENFYTLTLVSPSFFHTELAYIEDKTESKENGEAGYSDIPEPDNTLIVDSIRLNETVSVNIKLDHEVQAYHFIINDVEYKTGLPKWITYEEFDNTSGRLTFNGITRDYYIEVIVDEDLIKEPTPGEDIPYGEGDTDIASI